MYQPNQMQYYQQQQRPQYLKGYPVSSLEEARVALVDFDGSVFLFPDFANKKIYTKQINLDGTASLNMYELVPIPAGSTYVTKQDFDSVIAEIMARFPKQTEKDIQF